MTIPAGKYETVSSLRLSRCAIECSCAWGDIIGLSLARSLHTLDAQSRRCCALSRAMPRRMRTPGPGAYDLTGSDMGAESADSP